MLALTLPNGQTRQAEEGAALLHLAREFQPLYASPLVEAVFNGEACDLQRPLFTDGTVGFIEVNDEEGMRVYVRTLFFVFLAAARRLHPEARIEARNTLGSALYCIVKGGQKFTAEELNSIEQEMRQIVAADEKIAYRRISKAEAAAILKKNGNEERQELLCEMPDDALLSVYTLCGNDEYFFGPMCPSAGYTPYFELLPYENGMVLNYPDVGKWDELPQFKADDRLNEVFHEAEEWSAMIHCNTVSKLNKIIDLGYADKIIQVAEALHEKKIAGIADMIKERGEKLRLILIAGPSSSGKTSFTQRLSVQLAVNGIRPIPVSMDDYYKNRQDTPKKADGSYDFECIDALDLELFNEHLHRLLSGEKVKMPKYNFRQGLREYRGSELQMTDKSVLIVEGIHGLNEKLTASIAAENKMKIYVSALTPMSMDDYNRIKTTDMRLLRRVVRDSQFRSLDAQSTLSIWPDVRYGEEQYIFPYQDSADIMFNTTLIYEFAVLKKYAQPRLEAILPDAGRAYLVARRLLGLLQHVKPIDDSFIPNNSILREFIGGSVFKDAL